MAKVGLRIPRTYKIAYFTLLLTSWVSGISFFILNTWIMVEGDFGPEKHPWQFTFLKVHGGAAFLMMISYGFILASHVPAAWKTRRMRLLGLTITISLSFLVFTAYLLYYIAGEKFRIWVSYSHSAIGFSLPFLIISHLIAVHRSRRKHQIKRTRKTPQRETLTEETI
ncbi:MAG: hypothetical protein HRT88_16390 [Lentisphaeraceae bacterium]|nr:hypothetical protein [Lentisphaeraceae bacterium]